MRKSSVFNLCAIVLLSVFLIASGGGETIAGYSHKPNVPIFQKGMCYVTWTPDSYMGKKSDESIRQLRKIGTNSVQIVVTWYQDRTDSTIIKRDANRTPTDISVTHAIRKAHESGMAVMLKPHIDIIADEGTCRGDIGFASEEGWEDWFSHYRKFIKYYAGIAEENGVEFFCVGTELSFAATKVGYWRDDIIPGVRNIYSGKITYAANWDDYRDIGFWDLLDFAGIDAYFPLKTGNSPTVEELKQAWRPWVEEIESWQMTINKNVVFTECGYCSADAAQKRPWEEIFTDKVNLQLQADCYKALLETFFGKEWFQGLYWWAWNTYSGSGGTNHSRFTPQNKPAQGIVSGWYENIW